MPADIHNLHVCCVALGTRGDVQPVACIARHLQESHAHVTVSLITHEAHSSWLDTGIYAALTQKEYIASLPAGGCWGSTGHRAIPVSSPGDDTSAAEAAAAASANAGAAAAAAATVATTKPSRAGPPEPQAGCGAQAILLKPDPRVIEVIWKAISAAADGAAGANPDAPAIHHSDVRGRTCALTAEGADLDAGCPEKQTAESTQTSMRQRVRDLRQLLALQRREHEEEEEEQQQQRQQQFSDAHEQPQPRVCQRKQPRRRHLILFNLFALEAYHAAEALDVHCAVAMPYMIPYRCPAAFMAMFRSELPELHETLHLAAELERQRQQPGVRGNVNIVNLRSQPRVTLDEVTHWMWPLFTERWGDCRSEILDLPPLPLHRHRTQPHDPGTRACEVVPSATSPAAVAAAGTRDDRAEGSDEPLQLEELPPAPPLLYGFSEVLVPRPPYWPASVTVCGSWQPPLQWFTGYRLPMELEDLLSGSTLATAAAPPPPPAMVAPVHPGGSAAASAPRSSDTEADTAVRRSTAVAPGDWSTSLPFPIAGAGVPQAQPPGAPRLLSRADCPSGWCLVDFGSSGRLGLIPDPRVTLALLDRVLSDLGMAAILLTGGWQPLHQAAEELLRYSNESARQLRLRGVGLADPFDHTEARSGSEAEAAEVPEEDLRPSCAGQASGTGGTQRRVTSIDIVREGWEGVDAGRGSPEAVLEGPTEFRVATDPPPEVNNPRTEGVRQADPRVRSPELGSLRSGGHLRPLPVQHRRAKRAREAEEGPQVDSQMAADLATDAYSSAMASRVEVVMAQDSARAPVEEDDARTLLGAAASGTAAGTLKVATGSPATLRLHLYGGDVAHQLVLPYCRLVLHHGGSGTTAAALQCGVPQVICPLHFDQHFWAERLSHLGLSPPPLDRELLFGHTLVPEGTLDDRRLTALTVAFRDALKPETHQAAKSMAQELAAEGDGLESAARQLLLAAEGD